jgi:2-methylcitrate dehydratase PrpD
MSVHSIGSDTATTATRALVRRTRFTAGELSDDAVLIGKACLLDWIGVTLLGATLPLIDLLVTDALAEGGGIGSLVGRPEKVRVRDAGFINGVASHLLDYDDGLGALAGHATVAVAPALFALAEAVHADGKAFLTAFISGVEAAGCIGTLVAPDHYERGFHATGTVGAFGATAACALLLGLDEDRTVAAFGLAGVRAAALKSAFGTSAKPLQVGWAGVVGLTSAQWAQRGMDACTDVIGDRQGFAATHSADYHLDRALEVPPGGFHILSTFFKRYASCGVTHPTIDALRFLNSESCVTPEAIEAVHIRVARAADKMCNIAIPRTGLEAKFSLRAVAAMELHGVDPANPASFADPVATRADLMSFCERIDVTLDDTWPVSRSEVAIRLRGGRVLSHLQDGADQPKGVADTVSMVERKFHAMADSVLGEDGASAVVSAVADLDRADDIAGLLSLVNPKEINPLK